ncbi:MAG: MFS transporter [Clostridiales bacterium]|nr:MFS transporter [Clostridiales bacterium]
MMVLMPIFLRKFKTGYQALIVSQILTIACYVILFFTGRLNFWYCCILSFVATAVGAMVNALVNVLVNDTIDFILLKEGKQLNGIVSSVKGFAQKCGNTVTSSGILAIIAVAGFSTDYGIFGQPASATTSINIARFAVPALVSVVILVIMMFYPLKKYFPEIAAMKEKMREEQGE